MHSPTVFCDGGFAVAIEHRGNYLPIRFHAVRHGMYMMATDLGVFKIKIGGHHLITFWNHESKHPRL